MGCRDVAHETQLLEDRKRPEAVFCTFTSCTGILALKRSPRLRRVLPSLAGLPAFKEIHICCSRCFSVLGRGDEESRLSLRDTD